MCATKLAMQATPPWTQLAALAIARQDGLATTARLAASRLRFATQLAPMKHLHTQHPPLLNHLSVTVLALARMAGLVPSVMCVLGPTVTVAKAVPSTRTPANARARFSTMVLIVIIAL